MNPRLVEFQALALAREALERARRDSLLRREILDEVRIDDEPPDDVTIDRMIPHLRGYHRSGGKLGGQL